MNFDYIHGVTICFTICLFISPESGLMFHNMFDDDLDGQTPSTESKNEDFPKQNIFPLESTSSGG